MALNINPKPTKKMGQLITLEDWAEGLELIPRDPYTVSITEDDKEEFLFMCEDHPFIARGCLQFLAGKPESGKSTFGLCLLALCVSGKLDFLETANGEPIKALWIDTEQDRKRVAHKYRQVFEMAGLKDVKEKEAKRKLNVVSLLDCTEPEEMQRILEKKIRDVRPMFVFLDGVSDFVEDFNSVTESRNLLRKLMQLSTTYNCAIMCVIHLNKGASTKKEDIINGLQGVIGSKIAQKAQEGFGVDRSENLATILNAKSRNDHGRLKDLFLNATRGEHQIITLLQIKPILSQLSDMEEEEDLKDILIKAIKETIEKGENPNISQLKTTLEASFQIKEKRAKVLISDGLKKKWIKKDGKLYQIVEEPETQEDPL